jgi:hypothetical protein
LTLATFATLFFVPIMYSVLRRGAIKPRHALEETIGAAQTSPGEFAHVS